MSLVSELSRWKGQSILVLGDLMLDEFHWCEVSRISPEAPVPVCKVNKTSYSPGGAGNVASNIQSLGGNSSLLSLIGEDGSSRNLLSTFKELNLSANDLLQDASRSTLLKSRVIAQKQQVVRVDRDSFEPMTDAQVETVKDKVSQTISEVDVLVLSDYGKGFLTTEICQFAIQVALKHQIKVMVDPKGDDFKVQRGLCHYAQL